MRMQTWRLAQTLAAGNGQQLQAHLDRFDQSLVLLRSGDPSRPLFVPHDAESPAFVRARAGRLAGPACALVLGPGADGGRGRAAGRDLRGAHRRLRQRHREPARALDRAAQRLPVRDDGAGAGQRGGAAVCRLPVRLQPAGALAGGPGAGGRRRPVGARGSRQRRRIRRALGRLQPHGADAAGPVPEPGGAGAGEDAAPGVRARAPGGLVRGRGLRRHRHLAGDAGAGLRAPGAARGAGRCLGGALVGRVQPALPDAGVGLPAAAAGRRRAVRARRRLLLRPAPGRRGDARHRHPHRRRRRRSRATANAPASRP